jgi:hypothetical protein
MDLRGSVFVPASAAAKWREGRCDAYQLLRTDTSGNLLFLHLVQRDVELPLTEDRPDYFFVRVARTSSNATTSTIAEAPITSTHLSTEPIESTILS